jgi:hypothetical protein
MKLKRVRKKNQLDIQVGVDRTTGEVLGVQISPVYEDVIVENPVKTLIKKRHFWTLLIGQIIFFTGAIKASDKINIISYTILATIYFCIMCYIAFKTFKDA